MADFKRNIHKEFPGRNPFWGDPYEKLNEVTVPSIQAIQQYQLAKIEAFQKIASDQVAAKNQKLNALFLNGQINSLASITDSDMDVKLDEALEKIVSAINGTYAGNKHKDSEYNYSLLKTQLTKLKSAIEQLNSAIISQNANGGIPAVYLDTVNNAIDACSMESLDANVLDEWFKHLNKYKGDLVEDFGVAWLSLLKIPNVESIELNTGALNYQGDKKGHKGQIIQDLMSLQVTGLDLDNIPIRYRSAGEKTFVTTSLREFLNQMDQASNQHKQIILEDDGYDVLLGLSQLNIQAKAGLNQRPWNVNKSTQVSIGEFSPEDGLVVSAFHTFDLLDSLDKEGAPEYDWVATNSSDYNALANYGLATVLFKVLHLNEDGNNYLLTPQGFTTYTDRLKELMSRGKGNRRIGIKGNVTVDQKTMDNSYDVDFIGS